LRWSEAVKTRIAVARESVPPAIAGGSRWPDHVTQVTKFAFIHEG
jgi:hypothetical protein